MVAEEVIITLSGGAPWGFRLQGGVEHQKPLQVAKVRKRSKACRAGLREGDELVSINESSCGCMSHAQAMNLIDSIPGALHIRVKRAPAGFQSVVLVARAPSPRIDKEYRASLRAKSPSSSRPQQPSVRQVNSLISPTGRSGLTSPPGSEAYYGETDSDADVAAQERQRKQKRRSPSNSPGKAGRSSPEGGETSEMSGYDSAPDAQGSPLARSESQGDALPGVARREVVYQPQTWSSHTSTETSSMSADDQSPRDVVMEEDSGFQEPTNVPPLVSPERAKEAMMLTAGARGQLVPMVGPIDNPVDEELTLTYMDKAKQAKLNRGVSLQDKQVKEARTKCRTIASLLTDAPNPHSKGVLMFKKRRQRSKKYTLTSYGSVDEDMQPDSQEEDGHFPGSESEFDEDGFSAAPDPTWDSDYLDMLEKRSASRTLEGEKDDDSQSPGLSDTTGRGAQLFEQQRKRAEEHAKKMAAAQAQQSQIQSQRHIEPQTQPAESLHSETQLKVSVQPPPVAPKPARPPDFLLQQEALSSETHVIAPPNQVTLNENIASTVTHASDEVLVNIQPTCNVLTGRPPSPTPLPELPASSVLNRTARPFAPGFISHRSATAPVVFRPTVAKKTARPVSVAVVTPPFPNAPEEKATLLTPVSLSLDQISTSVPAVVPSPPVAKTTGPLSPPAAISDATQSLPQHLSTSAENKQVAPISAQTVAPGDSGIPSAVSTSGPSAGLTVSTTVISTAPSVDSASEMPLVSPTSAPMTNTAPSVDSASEIPLVSPTSAPMINTAAITPTSPVTPLSPVVYREKASGAMSRTGILNEARRRSTNKPMFTMLDSKKNSPNPELLSLVQNLDERPNYAYSESALAYPDDSYNVDDRSARIPPPVAPKPRVIPEVSQIPQAEGKGAELFARRQSRMDQYVVDSSYSPSTAPQQQQHVQPQLPQPQSSQLFSITQPCESSTSQSYWKYSPNVRAPPPIGYNPLLSPSCPLGLQRGGGRASEGNTKVGKSGYGVQKEGIKAIDFMRRQPYQLNSAMFSTPSSCQFQREGHTLTPPRQVPLKTARVYQIKRFSTPTPMSAPTLTPTVIAPRAQTTLGEPLSRSNMSSPPPAPSSPPPQPEPNASPARVTGLPKLPKISAAPIPHPTPYLPPAPMSSMLSLSYPGLQAAKQFKSAPELSTLPTHSLRSPVQVPKPRFIATRAGVQPRVWRPGALQY